jgi:hypothetical protein
MKESDNSNPLPTNDARRRIGIVLFLSLAIALHLGVVFSIVLQERPIIWPLHNDTIHRQGPGADFYAVYHAGWNLRHGNDPYANIPDGVTPYWFPFRYLPVVAYAVRPLTYLSPRTAYILWILILEGMLAVLLITLWNRIPQPGVRLATISILLLSSPYFLELYMGQFTFASIVLLWLGLSLPRGQILFCASVLIKPLTLATIPALAIQRRYRLHIISAIISVIFFSVPYFMVYTTQWTAFFEANFLVRGGLDAGNYGFLRLLQLIIVDGQILFLAQHWDVWTKIFRFLILAIVALLAFHSKRKSVTVGATAILLAHFLTYQHVWEHHISAISVLGAMLLTVPDRRKIFTAAVLVALVLLALPTPFGLLDGAKDPMDWDVSTHWPHYASYLIVLPKVVPTVLLFVASLFYLCEKGWMRPQEAMRSALAKPPGRQEQKKRRS